MLHKILTNTPPRLYYRDDVRERFIPISSAEVCATLSTQAHDPQVFSEFCQTFLRYTRIRLHPRIETLKRLYHPFNPDSDTLSRRTDTDAQREQLSTDFFEEITKILNHANFEPLSEKAINQAMSKISPRGIQTSVNFAEFDKIALYYRGSAVQVSYFRDWRYLWLRKKTLEIPVYRRLFILLKLKAPQTRIAELTQQGMSLRHAQAQVNKTWRRLPQDARATSIYLKIFKDMPDSDLEMFFPNVRIHLKPWDKIKLGITGGGGTIGGIFATMGKLSVALNPMAIATAILGFGGVIVRQISKLFHERTKYMMTLAQHLYFHNLSNNQGVLAYLLELALEEENKEALLAYFFLLHAAQPLTENALDHMIEEYLAQQWQINVDFEIKDGLRKLAQAGLLLEGEDGLQVHPPSAFKPRLF
jgi:hypothetical protein